MVSLNCFEEQQWKFLKSKKPVNPDPDPSPDPITPSKKKKRNQILIIVVLSVLALVALVIVFVVIHKKYNWPDFEKIKTWFQLHLHRK